MTYETAKAEYEARTEAWRRSADGIAYRERCRIRDEARRAFDAWLDSLATTRPHGCGYPRSISAGNGSAGRT